MLIRTIIIYTIFFFAFNPALATENRCDSAVSFYDHFQGEWQSEGDAFGMPAQSTMNWTRTLDDRFIHLDYKILLTLSDGKKSSFLGNGYYRPDSGNRYDGFWADNTGDLHPLKLECGEKEVMVHWGSDGEKQGRTQYKLNPSGTMTIIDWVLADESWRQFNKNDFIKVEAH